MRPEPRLEAGDGTEGLGVALEADRLPVDGCAACETVEAQTLVKVGPHVGQAASQPHGTSVFDSINLDEAILVPGPEDQAAALGQRRAGIEAPGMRMEGQAAAQRARYAAAWQEAGGVAIDPY
jgi:hypothetical protein